MPHVIILGAGVIGLQTALTLLQAGYAVTVIAKHFPGDEDVGYTSPWAGAVWRTHATSDDLEQCAWDKRSYEEWMRVVDREPERAGRMGIQRRPMCIYHTTLLTPLNPQTTWYTPFIQNLHILQPPSLPPGCKSGIQFDTIAINPDLYLTYLYTEVQRLGARVLRAEIAPANGIQGWVRQALHLTSESEVGVEIEGGMEASARAPAPVVFVNCTALSANSLCKDTNVHPIRGQTVLVRLSPPPAPEDVKIIMHPATAAQGGITYIVPRPGTDIFVLGGTKEDGTWDAEPDEGITQGILERCRQAWPEGFAGRDVQVLGVRVGLRPGRVGGARVEVEGVDVDGRVVRVVHSYGHAGAGYQNSIGCAVKVLGLVEGFFFGRGGSDLWGRE